jgi:hypothetical protein
VKTQNPLSDFVLTKTTEVSMAGFTRYDDPKTVVEQFQGLFQHEYEGAQKDERARLDFMCLTNYKITWTQVHGDFKDVAARARFVPYPHWKELHECCGIAVRETIAADKMVFYSDIMCARMMGAAMQILMDKYGLKAPRWWYPLMKELREGKVEKRPWNPNPFR